MPTPSLEALIQTMNHDAMNEPSPYPVSLEVTDNEHGLWDGPWPMDEASFWA